MLGMTGLVEELDLRRGPGVETSSATGNREHPRHPVMPRYPAPRGRPRSALATPATAGAASSSPVDPLPC